MGKKIENDIVDEELNKGQVQGINYIIHKNANIKNNIKLTSTSCVVLYLIL